MSVYKLDVTLKKAGVFFLMFFNSVHFCHSYDNIIFWLSLAICKAFLVKTAQGKVILPAIFV